MGDVQESGAGSSGGGRDKRDGGRGGARRRRGGRDEERRDEKQTRAVSPREAWQPSAHKHPKTRVSARPCPDPALPRPRQTPASAPPGDAPPRQRGSARRRRPAGLSAKSSGALAARGPLPRVKTASIHVHPSRQSSYSKLGYIRLPTHHRPRLPAARPPRLLRPRLQHAPAPRVPPHAPPPACSCP